MNQKVANLIQQIEDVFLISNPSSKAFELFRESGLSLTAIEEVLTRYCLFGTIDGAVNTFIDRYKDYNVANGLYDAAREILLFTIDPANTAQSNLFSIVRKFIC